MLHLKLKRICKLKQKHIEIFCNCQQMKAFIRTVTKLLGDLYGLTGRNIKSASESGCFNLFDNLQEFSKSQVHWKNWWQCRAQLGSTGSNSTYLWQTECSHWQGYFVSKPSKKPKASIVSEVGRIQHNFGKMVLQIRAIFWAGSARLLHRMGLCLNTMLGRRNKSCC